MPVLPYFFSISGGPDTNPKRQRGLLAWDLAVLTYVSPWHVFQCHVKVLTKLPVADTKGRFRARQVRGK
jgi:hypothetical protein